MKFQDMERAKYAFVAKMNAMDLIWKIGIELPKILFKMIARTINYVLVNK